MPAFFNMHSYIIQSIYHTDVCYLIILLSFQILMNVSSRISVYLALAITYQECFTVFVMMAMNWIELEEIVQVYLMHHTLCTYIFIVF